MNHPPTSWGDQCPHCARLVGLVCTHDGQANAIITEGTLERLDVWATRARAFQVALDTSGADRDTVARIAGSLLDLAEELDALRGRFKR